jgi:hypothetical protein
MKESDGRLLQDTSQQLQSLSESLGSNSGPPEYEGMVPTQRRRSRPILLLLLLLLLLLKVNVKLSLCF